MNDSYVEFLAPKQISSFPTAAEKRAAAGSRDGEDDVFDV